MLQVSQRKKKGMKIDPAELGFGMDATSDLAVSANISSFGDPTPSTTVELPHMDGSWGYTPPKRDQGGGNRLGSAGFPFLGAPGRQHQIGQRNVASAVGPATVAAEEKFNFIHDALHSLLQG